MWHLNEGGVYFCGSIRRGSYSMAALNRVNTVHVLCNSMYKQFSTLSVKLYMYVGVHTSVLVMSRPLRYVSA